RCAYGLSCEATWIPVRTHSTTAVGSSAVDFGTFAGAGPATPRTQGNSRSRGSASCIPAMERILTGSLPLVWWIVLDWPAKNEISGRVFVLRWKLTTLQMLRLDGRAMRTQRPQLLTVPTQWWCYYFEPLHRESPTQEAERTQ